MSKTLVDQNNLESVKAEIIRLSKIRNRLEEKEKKKTLYPQLDKMVGKYFRYRNCYSCPSKKSDYWWLYVKVVGRRGDSLLTVAMQKDKYGKIEIKTSEHYQGLSDGYLPIPLSLFNKKKGDFIKQINKL